MESKAYVAYRALFGHIHTVVPRFYPLIGMVDYEYQEQQAMHDEFPNCHIVGCYVHYVRVRSMDDSPSIIFLMFLPTFIAKPFSSHLTGDIQKECLHGPKENWKQIT